MVGTAFTPRASARCNGIIQAAIEGQRRPFIADWPADNFLRWAVSLGFLKWNRDKDEFFISELGKKLSQSKIHSDDEYHIYEKAFLSYPPISHIINLLVDAAENQQTLTKFEIGKQLGFIGEEGFTSISQNLFLKELITASQSERKIIKSNWEGDSDKYARMICNWLIQLKYPWVSRTKKNIELNLLGEKYQETLQSFAITKKGYEIRKMSLGISRFKKIPKIVFYEMLSTKGRDRKYLRTRRAYLIKFLKNSISIPEILKKFDEKVFSETASNILDDIQGLRNIGLNIMESRGRYICSDIITGLIIPSINIADNHKSLILKTIEDCRRTLSNIPHNYLVLILMSFDRSQSKMFEIKTIELLTEYCNFKGLHLGGISKPDGIIYSNKYGVIIDN